MNLDDFNSFSSIDIDDMLGQISGLPKQLNNAWEMGLTLPLPALSNIKQVVIAGMGGSAIGADLVASFLADRASVPLFIQRDYDLPAFAFGKDTLVIISSHSGNTEEALSAFEAGIRNNCQLLVITTGGKALAEAKSMDKPVWVFSHDGQPRSAVGYSFGLLLALFVRLGLVSDLSNEVKNTVTLMLDFVKALSPETPVRANPAKRLAGQLVGRHITIFGSGFMAPVARRWKCQFNEVAKTIASFEVLPEADHNTLAGICHPQEAIEKEIAVFIQASTDYVRNNKRVLETRQIMLVEGINTDLYNAKGQTRLEQMWTTILFGDFVSYYLAILYDIDPTAIPPILALKEAMSQ